MTDDLHGGGITKHDLLWRGFVTNTDFGARLEVLPKADALGARLWPPSEVSPFTGRNPDTDAAIHILCEQTVVVEVTAHAGGLVAIEIYRKEPSGGEEL